MFLQVNIEEFLSIIVSENVLVLDVRSENEFAHGHIPGSVNLPLLNNEQRAIVGTVYKNQGREAAVEKGFELRGGSFSEIISKVREQSTEKKVLIYCWRGGMRSSITSWILHLAGYKIMTLKGGYKTFRKWVLNSFKQPLKLVVLGGKTGTGKTEILRIMGSRGYQVIDLEQLAHHKGSTFGGLGQPAQPTNEHFENGIAFQILKSDLSKAIWIENESRLIGKNLIPDPLFDTMRNAEVIELELSHELRLEKIVKEYGQFPIDDLKERTKKIAKRLGGLRLKESLELLENYKIKEWAEMMLAYYDSLYNYSNNSRKDSNCKIKLNSCNFEEEAGKIMELNIRV